MIESIIKLPPTVCVELNIYGRSDTEEENQYLDSLKNMANTENRIKFCGELRENNRSEVMQSFDLLAIPSIWLETGPYVLLEAFASGIPVIGSDLGGISERVTNNINGLLVEPGSIESWSKSIMYLYENPEMVQKYASNIPVVRSSMDVAKEVVNVYQDTMQ